MRQQDGVFGTKFQKGLNLVTMTSFGVIPPGVGTKFNPIQIGLKPYLI